VLKTFKDKELFGLWSMGRSKIDGRMHKRILIRLGVLNDATTIDDVKLPGYDFHAPHVFKPVRYTIRVNARGASYSNSKMATPIELTSSSTIRRSRHYRLSSESRP
jgi:proteic killer suppression protein